MVPYRLEVSARKTFTISLFVADSPVPLTMRRIQRGDGSYERNVSIEQPASPIAHHLAARCDVN